MLSFETERLILKPSSIEDAAFLVALFNTPKWLKYIGDRNVRTIAQAKEYIRTRITPQFELLGFGSYVAIRKSDQVKIGTCGLFDREGVDGIDLGFAFLPEYESQGYAYEAAMKIKEAGFNAFSLQKISAITTMDNVAAQKLLQKLGFQFQEFIKLPNDDVELMLYAIEGE